MDTNTIPLEPPAAFSASGANALDAKLAALPTPAERLALLAKRFPGEIVATTSFGVQSPVMLHLLRSHAPEIPIVFIDTGYLFSDTYLFAERLIKMWDLNIRLFQPAMTSARQEALYGKLWEQGDGGRRKYALLNKIEPMNRALRELGSAVWISGLRRSQSSTRKELRFATMQNSTLKAYPILDWDDEGVESYFERHELPRHPLVYKGYVSVGDWHSTVPLQGDMKPDETRQGLFENECGLHLDYTI